MRAFVAALLDRMGEDRGSRALTIGATLSLLWLLMLLAFWLTAEGGGGARWVSVIAALMPLALIWLAVGLARAVDTMRAEADLLRAMLDQMRRDGEGDPAGLDRQTRPASGGLGAGGGLGGPRDQDPRAQAEGYPEAPRAGPDYRANRSDLPAPPQASARVPVGAQDRRADREDHPGRNVSDHGRTELRARGADADLSARAGSQNRRAGQDGRPERGAHDRERSNRRADPQASAADGHRDGLSARSARQTPPAKTSPRPEQAESQQQSLRFDTPEPADLAPETLILALNFPDGPDDRYGIAALREALHDPDHARLLRSAQDVVSLLAARDLFMDELTPGPVDRDAWLRFAEGQRGQAVAGVGAIRDPDALGNAATVMRGDEVFRDAAHHFLRLFDRSLTRLLPQLDDEAIGWLAETRSARAFMLLGRVAGLFGQED